MVDLIDTAYVKLWGKVIGAVSWIKEKEYAVFEFEKEILKLGLDISPLHMPLQKALQGDMIFSFPSLNKETFHGLPGLLADSLPDKFGNTLIDAWLARNGRDPNSFSPIERLCYIGKRGMGALEFSPSLATNTEDSVPVEIADLVRLAQEVSSEHFRLNANISDNNNTEAMLDIIRVGTSAGGARPKAVVAVNADGHVRSGQVKAPAGYDYWIIKFDGVDDLELGKTQGYGRIEYAYHLMAKACGINMTPCRLLEEGGRAHFMTKRFDRDKNTKVHLQSLCGLAHYDFNLAGGYSYEQVFSVMRQLHLPKTEAHQQFCRMVLNVVARNQDDHTKNISFLLDSKGKWHLSPAYDFIYAHNPAGHWTNKHQMTINGKREGFTLQDLVEVGDSIGLPNPKETIMEIIDTVKHWPKFAQEAGVRQETIERIKQYHRYLDN
ncbi:MAG: type II toxin-antitoxin system HipA family toxin [Actinomycetia bacterium]|nr:type II toxin-antitoxin system HipA family toxin [Actinomycetes bacterium]